MSEEQRAAPPRSGALRPDEESDLDRMARSADTDAEIHVDEGETPTQSGLGPGAGEVSPSRVRAPRDPDPRRAQSYPSLRGDTADGEAGH